VTLFLSRDPKSKKSCRSWKRLPESSGEKTIMNDDERLIWGRYLSAVANSRRQELEALDELLNEIGKPFTEAPTKAEKPTEGQFNGLNWVTKKGTKGDYDQTANDGSPEFKALADYVKVNKGFVHFCGHKVFFHYKDENLIDRKR